MAYATPADYAAVFDVPEDAGIQQALDIGASKVDAVLASAGMGGCSFPDWALEYLKYLNIAEAALLRQSGVGTMRIDSDSYRELREYLSNEYSRILKGEIELCDGATGNNMPYADFIQMASTPAMANRIIVNNLLKNLL